MRVCRCGFFTPLGRQEEGLVGGSVVDTGVTIRQALGCTCVLSHPVMWLRVSFSCVFLQLSKGTVADECLFSCCAVLCCAVLLCGCRCLQDTTYWKQQLWSAHDRVECEVLQGMHDQGLPVVKVRIASNWRGIICVSGSSVAVVAYMR